MHVPCMFEVLCTLLGQTCWLHAEDVARRLACGVSGSSSAHNATSCNTGASWRFKRQRDAVCGTALDASDGRPKPLRGMAEILAQAQFTEAQLDACSLRCGVGALVPMRGAVRTIFRKTIARYCGVLPLEVLRRIFEQAIGTGDQVLFGKMRAQGAVRALSAKLAMYLNRVHVEGFVSTTLHRLFSRASQCIQMVCNVFRFGTVYSEQCAVDTCMIQVVPLRA